MPARSKRIWRRRFIRAILCLLLGAVTTVGVAWGCVLLGEPPRLLHEVSVQRERAEIICREFGAGPWCIRWVEKTGSFDSFREHTRLHTRRAYGRGDFEALGDAAAAMPDVMSGTTWQQTALAQRMLAGGWGRLPEADGVHRCIAAGWPLRSMWGWLVARPDPVRRCGLLGTTWMTGASDAPDIPLIPILPGFLLDTLFYAAPWWLILITPGALKRSRRRRRGRCIHCGYDLAGLPAGTVSGGTVLRTVTGTDSAEQQDTARRAVPPTCPECGT